MSDIDAINLKFSKLYDANPDMAAIITSAASLVDFIYSRLTTVIPDICWRDAAVVLTWPLRAGWLHIRVFAPNNILHDADNFDASYEAVSGGSLLHIMLFSTCLLPPELLKLLQSIKEY